MQELKAEMKLLLGVFLVVFCFCNNNNKLINNRLDA
jgi:hypothetical protein